MAQVRWYLNNSLLDGWALVDQTAATAATTAYGWNVGTGATFSSELQSAGGDRASTTFTANTVPDGTLDTTLKDAFRSQFAQNGSFAAGDWTFQFAVVSPTQGGAADGQIVFRILKANADGSSATEITSGQQAASVVTNVASSPDSNSSATISLGAFTITNQYLFIQVAWKRTGAGGMTSTNIRLRTGSSSTVGTTGLTADYTPLVLPATIASTAVIVGRGPSVAGVVTGVTIPSASAAFTGHAVVNAPPVQAAVLSFIPSSAHPLHTDTLLFERAGSSTYYALNGFGPLIAQSISGHDGEISSVSLNMRRVGAPTDQVYLEIRQTTITGTLLAESVPIQCSTLTTSPVWRNFPLLNTVTMSSGSTYFIRLMQVRTEPVAAGNDVGWFYVAGNPYAGGAATNGTTGTPLASGDHDLTFRLYTGTSHTVANAAASQAVWASFIPSSAHPFSTPETSLFELAGVSAYYQCSIDGPALAQSISGHDGAISSISLTLRKGGSPTDHVYLEVRQTTATGTLLATSAPIVASTLTTVPVWRNFPLTNTVLLVGGSTYFIRLVLTRTEADGPNFVGWFISTSAYAAGAATTAVGGTLNGGVDDLTFRLYTGESHRVTNGDIIAGETIASGSQVHVPTVAEGDKVINVAFIGASLAPVAVAAFNFRGSAAYVTDGAGQTYVLGSTAYPTNRDSLTFGWLTAALHANRSTSVDVRLAGLNYATGSVDEDFQFDLPSAGTYLVGLAMGDITAAQSNQQIEIYDNTTLVFTIGRRNVAAGEFWDASDVKYTAAAWPTSQTPVSLVFATTTLILRLKGDGSSSAISHLSVEDVPTGGSAAVLYPVDVAHVAAGTQTIDGATITSTSQLSTPAIDTVAVPTILSGALVGTTQLFENPWSGGTLSATLAGRNFSQTISGHDGLLTSVALKLRKTGAPTDALYVDIRDAFNGTLLATSASLAFTDVPPGSTSAVNNWYLFPLDTPVSLVAATTYWIGVYRTAGSVSKFPYLLYDLLEPYPAGVLYDAAGAPQSGGTADLAFRLYVAAAPTVAAAQLVTGGHIVSTSVVREPTVPFGILLPGQTLFTDDSNRSDGGLGANWQGGYGAHANLAIVGNRVRGTIDGGDGSLQAIVTALPNDCWGLVQIPTVVDDGNTRSVQIGLRMADPPSLTQGYAFVMVNQSSGNVWNSAIVSFAGPTLLASESVTPWAGGDWLLATAQGTTLTMYRLPAGGNPDIDYFAPVVQTTDGASASGRGALKIYVSSGVALSEIEADNVRFGLFGVVVTGAHIASGSTVSAPAVSGGELPTTSTVVLRRVVPQFYRDVYRRSYTLRYRRIVLTVEAGPAPPTTQTIVGATIGGSVGDLLLEDSSGVLLEDGSAMLLEGSVGLAQVFAPSVDQIALAQAVTTVPITSGSLLNVPSIAPGPVTVTGATRLTTASVNVPSVAVGPVTVTGTTITAASVARVPSVTTGPVTITGATLPTTAQTFVPSVVVGAVTVAAAHRATTIQVFAPALTSVSLGATIPSSSGVFAPSLAPVVVMATRPTTSQIFAPTLAQTVAVPHRASLSQTFEPSLSAGAIAVEAPTLASALQLFVVTVSVGAVLVTGATLASASIARVPSVATGPVSVTASTVAATSQTFVPSIAVGAATVVASHRPATSAVFAPTLASVSLGATIPSASGLFAPSLAATVTTATRSSTAVLFAPTVAQTVTGAHHASTHQVFAPTLATGPVAVGGATLPTTAQLFTPVIAVGATTVAGAHIPSIVQVHLPIVALAGVVNVGAATISGPALVHAPTIATGPVSVTTATRLTTIQVFAPTLTVQALGATIVSGSGTFAPSVAVAVIATSVSSTSQVFTPVVATAGVTAVSGATISAGSQTYALTVAAGPVTVVGATRASTSQLFVVSVTTLTTISTTTISSTGQRFAPTVATGPVTVMGVTVTSTLQVFAPSIAVGVTSITGATRGSTAVLFPPTFITALDGTFIVSATALFPPTVKLTQFVTTAPIPVGATPSAPSVLPLWEVTGGTRPSTIQTFAPSVTTGPITITGSTVPSTGQMYAPALLPDAVTITVPHLASTLQVFAPTVSNTAEGAHCPSTVGLFPPVLATGPVAVSTGAIVSTIQVFPPSLGVGITTGALASTSLPFAPTLIPLVTTPLWIVRTQLFPPSAIPLGEMILTFLPSGSAVFPPFMVGHAPPPEILDFTSNLVREIMGTATVCRSTEGTVILTRDVTLVATVDRVVEMSASVVRREVEVGVER